MCMMELATKTNTADSRIGSQRAVRETMCSLLKAQEQMPGLRTRGYDSGEVAVKRSGARVNLRTCGSGPVLCPRIRSEEGARPAAWFSAIVCLTEYAIFESKLFWPGSILGDKGSDPWSSASRGGLTCDQAEAFGTRRLLQRN